MTTTVTTEEAAALMIGLDYIPPGVSFQEMTAAFLEEAEVELHNAKIDKVDWRQLSFLEQRVLACQHRHELAGIYLEALELELGKGRQSILTPNTEGSVSSRIDRDQLDYWASNLFGITIPCIPPDASQATPPPEGADSDTQLPRSMASTYTTFSLILEAYLENAKPKHKSNDALNVLQFAKDLEALGKKYNSGMRWDGQGHESIRNRLGTIAKYHPAELLKK
jgi:hypothetical protein